MSDARNAQGSRRAPPKRLGALDPRGQRDGVEQGFLQEIERRPHDDDVRLVYADWLEEQGDDRGEYLRLDVNLASLEPGDALYDEHQGRWERLRERISADWLACVGRAQVVFSPLLGVGGPLLWTDLKQLKPRPRDGIRLSETRLQMVYYCQSLENARRVLRTGRLIALDYRMLLKSPALDPLPHEGNDVRGRWAPPARLHTEPDSAGPLLRDLPPELTPPVDPSEAFWTIVSQDLPPRPPTS